MPSSQPFHCPECSKPEACGYYGVLVFADDDGKMRPGSCRHNEKPGKPCHSEPVKLVPVRET